MRKKPELLAPAGDMEKLRMAVLYGADAVYLAGTSFGMRSFAGNFTADELPEAVRFAHDHGVRVHVTVNTMPRNDEVARLPEHLERLNDLGVDALILADLGAFTLAGRYAPRCERHISTQQSIANYECARAWYDLGAKRVVLAREVSLQEIREMRAKLPSELELETFCHGAMCVSYSGRCLLSNYMTGRDSNRGACAQPCRYQYALMEEKRPGEYFPVFEDEKGTYIMNSRDMCMIGHLDDIMDAGIDCIKIEAAEAIPQSAYAVDDTLIDPDANVETRVLFSYLCDRYGEQVLAGQFADRGLDSDEFRAIKDVTGKTPAILGLDMMDLTPSRVALGTGSDAVERAIEFHNAGGIVTFCWHWNAPTAYLKEGTEENGSPRWWGGFYTRNTDFDIAKVMDGSDPEGKALIDADIAGIAQQLLRLQEAGVPILWRPLHEASGGWFWWGAKGAEPYKALYKYLYDQLTNVYGCHNLIWVWNGQSADWYPGDEYVDIIGEDIYVDKHSYTAHAAKFSEILDYSGGKKIIALTENGTIFDIDNVMASGAKWACFTTWNGGFITANGRFSDEHTEAEILKKDYLSEYVITLDELPDWESLKAAYTPETVAGDVNKDGVFDVSDIVLLQKWLLAVPDTHLADWKAADLYQDDRLDVFDLCMMKRKLINA